MKKWFKRLKDQKGLTLVELLAVVVILGIVAAIAVPAVGNIIDNSKKDAHQSNALLIINAAKLGLVTGELTSTDDSTPSSTTSYSFTLQTLVDKGLLDTIPADPSINGKAYSPSSIVIYTLATTGQNAEPAFYSIRLYDNGGTKTYYNSQTEEKLNNGTATLTVPAQ